MAGKINVNFTLLKENYPDSQSLQGQVKTMADYYVSKNKSWTSCVMQMSVALNAVQELIPQKAPNGRLNDYHKPFFYMLAVADFKIYLATRYGPGESLQGTLPERTKAINKRQGILTFANDHTELWDKDHHVQNGVDRKTIMSAAAVSLLNTPTLFWEVGAGTNLLSPVPTWLVGWWEVKDGQTWYYYFSPTHTVTYTQVKPNTKKPPVETLESGGVVTLHPNGFTLEIKWNPAGGDNTIETFTRAPSTIEMMAGRSNRFAPLQAVKLK